MIAVTTESPEPPSLEATLREANAEWVAALDALRSARSRIMTAAPSALQEAQEALEKAERLVEQAGERLADVAGKLARARRGDR